MASADLSNSHLSSLVHDLDALIWEADPDTLEFSFVSQGSEELLGYAPAQWLSEKGFWIRRIHPDDRADVLEAMRSGIARNRKFDLEYRMLAAGGRTVWIRQIVTVVGNDHGRRLRGVMTDISQHKQREERLRTHISQQDAIAALGLRGLSDSDPAALMDEAVRLVAEHLEVEFAKVLELVPDRSVFLLRSGVGWKPGYAGVATIENSTASQAGYTLLFSEPVIVEDMSRETRFRAPEILVEHGVVSGMSVVISGRQKSFGVLGAHSGRKRRFTREDTNFLQSVANVLASAIERREAEEGLRRSEGTIRALLESASQAIIKVDRSGVIRMLNAKTLEMFGYTREELLGTSLERLTPENARRAHAASRAEYFEHPRVRPMGLGMELLGLRKDGKQFPIEVSLSYVRTEEGLSAIAFVTDVSERKRLQEQLMQSQKMEAVGRLAGGVAHDFNNMLTVISGYDRMLLDQLSTADPLRGFAEEILKAADRASGLTNQLLSFSRRQAAQPKILNLNAVVSDMDRMLRRLIGEDIELAVRLRPDLGNIKADPTHIEQVIMNLVVNARDAMSRGGRITIETEPVHLDPDYVRTHLGVRAGNYAMVAVTDTGTGMDAETRSHIFEPFFTTKEKGKGTGLGLSTVYGVVKQNHGDIWVYSEPGKGTTFKIYFPIVEEEQVSDSASAVLQRSRGTETVLVVEDEAGVRKLVSAMLTQQGYTVLEASDSVQALEISKAHPHTIHLLITDVVLPQVSGGELAAEMRKRRPGTKVLFMSGYTESTIVDHGVNESGVEFLAKPFSLETLVTKVRRALDRTEPSE